MTRPVRHEYLPNGPWCLPQPPVALLADAAVAGAVRSDIDPGELASYCLHALTAAGNLPSKEAVRRLLAVTMSGLRPGVGMSGTVTVM